MHAFRIHKDTAMRINSFLKLAAAPFEKDEEEEEEKDEEEEEEKEEESKKTD